ncbi:thiamine pyrophosphate-binding protein [Bombella sp. TMW 2.2559]|uniref:Thiamine pyrophosphate-binding protein n=1 Tax=Bombella dulcis TaxID=2967339 RepID=A0ABT3WB58_9PROT|nr:thiamine pyrophosphate-binding protein [Bombella dulcis]MCX5616171.1 thiamine pyrophosphate-binding protein [Bombella dulcis]
MVKVVDYLLEQLSRIGIEHVFGVPGDYAFPINDAITAREDMRWIGCSNELNAAYAADGYARVRGVAALNTTYGVGELSAMNGVAGAYAEHLPIIHLVGMPRRAILEEKRLVHHTLANGQLMAFYEAAGHVVCARTVLDGLNCVREVERVLTALRKERQPVYIGIPADAAHDDVVMPENHASPQPEGNRKQAETVAHRIISELARSTNPCVLPGILTARFGCREAVRLFLARSGLPYATMYMDKGVAVKVAPFLLMTSPVVLLRSVAVPASLVRVPILAASERFRILLLVVVTLIVLPTMSALPLLRSILEIVLPLEEESLKTLRVAPLSFMTLNNVVPCSVNVPSFSIVPPILPPVRLAVPLYMDGLSVMELDDA